jgi:hypothetical protein
MYLQPMIVLGLTASTAMNFLFIGAVLSPCTPNTATNGMLLLLLLLMMLLLLCAVLQGAQVEHCSPSWCLGQQPALRYLDRVPQLHSANSLLS